MFTVLLALTIIFGLNILAILSKIEKWEPVTHKPAYWVIQLISSIVVFGLLFYALMTH